MASSTRLSPASAVPREAPGSQTCIVVYSSDGGRPEPGGDCFGAQSTVPGTAASGCARFCSALRTAPNTPVCQCCGTPSKSAEPSRIAAGKDIRYGIPGESSPRVAYGRVKRISHGFIRVAVISHAASPSARQPLLAVLWLFRTASALAVTLLHCQVRGALKPSGKPFPQQHRHAAPDSGTCPSLRLFP